MRRPVPTLIAAAASLVAAAGLVSCTIAGGEGSTGAVAAGHEHSGHPPSTHSVAIRDLARGYGVEMPITEQVARVCHEGADPRVAVTALMSREIKPE